MGDSCSQQKKETPSVIALGSDGKYSELPDPLPIFFPSLVGRFGPLSCANEELTQITVSVYFWSSLAIDNMYYSL